MKIGCNLIDKRNQPNTTRDEMMWRAQWVKSIIRSVYARIGTVLYKLHQSSFINRHVKHIGPADLKMIAGGFGTDTSYDNSNRT